MYLLIRVKSLMSLKVWSILGPPKKKSKSPKVGRFSENHTKSNFSDRHLLLYDFRYPSFFVKFSKTYPKTRVSELATPVRSSWVHASERPKSSLNKSSKSSLMSQFAAKQTTKQASSKQPTNKPTKQVKQLTNQPTTQPSN